MFQVQILGTSAAIPTKFHRPSAQVVSYHDRHYLVDCGEGTQMQLLRYRVKLARLDAIFISHLHGDHVFGLPGLLTSMSLYGRNFPLKLYAPAALKKVLEDTFKQTESYLMYDLEFIPMEDFEPGSVIFDTKRLKVYSLPLEHRIFCRGFRFEEYDKRPKFNFYEAKALEIPNEYFALLKQGNEVTLPDGRLINPGQVLSPPDPILSYAYCSDTKYSEPLVDYIKEATVLYHESTFLDDMKKRAAETAHSTSREAAEIAKRAAVRQLILGHFSARYKSLEPMLMEAREIFPYTELANEGKIFKIKDYL
jgi:ribonuclease Z